MLTQINVCRYILSQMAAFPCLCIADQYPHVGQICTRDVARA